MNKRLTLLTVLVILVILGLVAGVFAGAIQKALIIPVSQMMARPAAPAPAPAAPTKAPPVVQGNANTLAQDTFQRQNQQLWGTATDGRAWQGDANMLNAFSIANASGQIANAQGTLNAVLGQPVTNVNVTMNGSLNHFNKGNVNLGAVVRWTDGNNWYKAFIDGTHLTMLKRVKGVTTTLGTTPFQAQDGTMYSLRFQAIGAMLFAKAWPVGTAEPTNWMLNITDTALTTGQAGIRVLLQKATVATITNFQVTPATMGNTV
ncbi:MAG TPA: hypothetical protein VGT82_14610 [Ktedonobacteraceae bacterium]|nr:hypothetical protein [Ktedonobacteraceae bacterium]